MKLNGLRLLSVLLISSLNFVSGHSYHLDRCPDFEPMPDFVMEKFLGPWYAVQMTATSIPCAEYDFRNAPELTNKNCINCTNCLGCTNCRDCVNCKDCTNCTNSKDCSSCVNSHGCTGCVNGSNCTVCHNCTNCTGCTKCTGCTNCAKCTNLLKCTNCTSLSNCTGCTDCTVCPKSNLTSPYTLEQTSGAADTNAAKSIDEHYIGQLKADPRLPSRMTVSFPQNNAGKSSFAVFATDYVNYAGIYSCEKTLSFGHGYSVTVLSRSKVLDKMYLDKMHNLIVSANVSPNELSDVDQSNCNNRQTFITNNIKQAVTEVGDNIEQDIKNMIDDVKKVYISVQSRLTEEISGNPGVTWFPYGYL